MDAHVVLPRWHQVIMKLSEKLKHIPGATEALVEWAKEEGPANTGVMVKTDEVQRQIEQEKAEPHYAYHHRQHTCPRCARKFRCFDAHCTEPSQVCRKCLEGTTDSRPPTAVNGQQEVEPRFLIISQPIGEVTTMPETHEHECPKCRNTFNCDRVPCAGPPELCPACAGAEEQIRSSDFEIRNEKEEDPAPEESPREEPPAGDPEPEDEPGDTKKKTSEPQAAEEVSAQAQIAAEGTVRSENL